VQQVTLRVMLNDGQELASCASCCIAWPSLHNAWPSLMFESSGDNSSCCMRLSTCVVVYEAEYGLMIQCVRLSVLGDAVHEVEYGYRAECT